MGPQVSEVPEDANGCGVIWGNRSWSTCSSPWHKHVRAPLTPRIKDHPSTDGARPSANSARNDGSGLVCRPIAYFLSPPLQPRAPAAYPHVPVLDQQAQSHLRSPASIPLLAVLQTGSRSGTHAVPLRVGWVGVSSGAPRFLPGDWSCGLDAWGWVSVIRTSRVWHSKEPACGVFKLGISTALRVFPLPAR